MTWRSTADVAQHFSLAEHSVQLLSDLSSTALSILQGTNSRSEIHPDMLQKQGKKQWIALMNR